MCRDVGHSDYCMSVCVFIVCEILCIKHCVIPYYECDAGIICVCKGSSCSMISSPMSIALGSFSENRYIVCCNSRQLEMNACIIHLVQHCVSNV